MTGEILSDFRWWHEPAEGERTELRYCLSCSSSQGADPSDSSHGLTAAPPRQPGPGEIVAGNRPVNVRAQAVA
jgi:hypothetical protein